MCVQVREAATWRDGSSGHMAWLLSRKATLTVARLIQECDLWQVTQIMLGLLIGKLGMTKFPLLHQRFVMKVKRMN